MFDFIVNVIAEGGYVGVFLLMAAENILPPIPSELIMPLAGFNAARGEFNPVVALLSGTAGSVLGMLPWYYAGRIFGKERLTQLAERHGKWLTVTENDVDRALHAFSRHGRKAVFFGRLVPAVRTLISVPAGIANMAAGRFLAYSAAGSLIWSATLMAAGYLLQAEYRIVAEYLDPVSTFTVGLIAFSYLYRLAKYRSRRNAKR